MDRCTSALFLDRSRPADCVRLLLPLLKPLHERWPAKVKRSLAGLSGDSIGGQFLFLKQCIAQMPPNGLQSDCSMERPSRAPIALRARLLRLSRSQQQTDGRTRRLNLPTENTSSQNGSNFSGHFQPQPTGSIWMCRLFFSDRLSVSLVACKWTEWKFKSSDRSHSEKPFGRSQCECKCVQIVRTIDRSANRLSERLLCAKEMA